jgi:hypothetical protein
MGMRGSEIEKDWTDDVDQTISPCSNAFIKAKHLAAFHSHVEPKLVPHGSHFLLLAESGTSLRFFLGMEI